MTAVLAAWLYLRASLPLLDGERTSPGLRGAVRVQRDAVGAVTLRGAERGDVAFATGFVHAQDRFFQMDLLRRAGAGELAALLGPRLVGVDRARRVHRFRARAEQALASVGPAERALLDRYVDGVNAGLGALAARPFEYAVLRVAPAPWRAEDSLLVAYAMYFDLQDEQLARVFSRGFLRDQGASGEQLAFLLPTSTAYDAPLDGPWVAASPAPLPASAPAWFGQPLPAASAAAGRVGAAPSPWPLRAAAALDPLAAAVGSNNAAIAGRHGTSGAALVEVDMHLGLRLPHIWYRAALEIGGDAAAPALRLVGVMLPGAPLVVAGSNGRVAWGFTNSNGQYVDLVELDLDPADPGRYRTGDGWTALRFVDERIEVSGEPSQTLRVAESAFGPVVLRAGKSYAVRWTAHDAGAAGLGLAGLEQATTVDDALSVGAAAGVPAQNMVAGDAAGRIGWTIAGSLPDRRTDFTSTFPQAASAPAAPVFGWRAFAASRPRIVDPAGGVISTANSRQLAGDDAARIGDGGLDLGARSRQLRDSLAALVVGGDKVDEAKLESVSLDDRALYLAPWRERLLHALADSASPATPRRAELRRVLETTWSGRASVDSAAYTLTRAWLHALYRRGFGAIDARLREADRDASFARASARWPAVLARLLDERPAGWLPHGLADWRAVELAAADDAIDGVLAEFGGAPADSGAASDARPAGALADARWGRRNTARIVHPLAAAIPFAARFLSAPADELPGDSHMPRVAAPAFGQSERIVVSPGREQNGRFAMPGGQSGHPASPFFLAGHDVWAKGDSIALLPGPAIHTLTLRPEASRP